PIRSILGSAGRADLVEPSLRGAPWGEMKTAEISGESRRATGIGPLTDLPGIGPARARAFSRMGVRDVRDLLFLVPRRLSAAGPPVPIAVARESTGREVRVAGKIARIALQRYGRRSTLRVVVEDEGGSIPCLYFNQPWLRQRFAVGEEVE